MDIMDTMEEELLEEEEVDTQEKSAGKSQSDSDYTSQDGKVTANQRKRLL